MLGRRQSWNMKKIILLSAIPLILLMGLVSNGAEIDRSFCSWLPKSRYIICEKNQFQCFNGKCIKREYYCDNGNDCGDNSDERYCSVDSCPENPLFIRCQSSRKCVPEEFICNGYKDCPSGDDETDCEIKNHYYNKRLKSNFALHTVLQWMLNQKTQKTTAKWGSQVDKSAMILFFGDRNFTISQENETIKEIAYEVSIQLLSRLTSMKLQDIPSTDLASFLNAFLVMCLDARKFHGQNIVQELRSRVDHQNYTNPYVLLSLCNAGETITETDKMKLIDIFRTKRRPFWTDMQALVVMALACANKQSGNEVDSETLHELTMELKQLQYRNGTIENLQTTALVMQALISVDSEKDPDNFDEIKALEEILRNQETDGSFGDLMTAYFVVPVLTCNSLIDINSDHCQYAPTDENSALENLASRSGPKIRVQYSLWIGNEKDLERNLVLRVPVNMSFYEIMEIAAEVDSRYRFEYTVKNRKPYINAVSGLRDNPEKGKFWFLYAIQDGQPTPSKDSPAEVLPKDNDHYVMWYRSGSWID